MQNGYDKKVILFYPGASGNFLASFLVVNATRLPSFRVDHKQTLDAGVIVASGGGSSVDGRLQDFESSAALDSIRYQIEHGTKQVIMSHYQRVSDLREYTQCWVRKIYPRTNLIGWIKNVHFKKQELEFVDYTQANMSTRVDQTVMFIRGWVEVFKADTDVPDDLVINFGDLYNIDYLATLFEQANGFTPDAKKLNWARRYVEQQFAPMEYVTSASMTEIAEHIKPQDFFDLAAVLFMYENYHNTVDRNRLWSIDELPDNVDDALKFLLDNQKNYTIFYA